MPGGDIETRAGLAKVEEPRPEAAPGAPSAGGDKQENERIRAGLFRRPVFLKPESSAGKFRGPFYGKLTLRLPVSIVGHSMFFRNGPPSS